MPRLTEAKREALVQRYIDGVPTAAIAKEFGVSESYPSQLAAKLNLPRRHSDQRREAISIGKRDHDALDDRFVEEIAKPAGPKPMTVNTVAEIRRLSRLGRRRTEIAALLRCPYREVEAALA